MLYRKGRIVAGADKELRKEILQQLHDGAVRGHCGMTATLKKVSQVYYWRKLKVDVFDHVKRCEICQNCKGEHVKSPELLQPLPIPEKVWQDISIDFIEGLQKSHGISVVMVVAERLSKYAHFICLKHPYIAACRTGMLGEDIKIAWSASDHRE